MIWGKSIFPTFAVTAPAPVLPPLAKPAAYTPEQVEALSRAMWQLLDDMGENGTCVCGDAKALARVAYEPFMQADLQSGELDDGCLPDMTLEAALALIADVER